MWSEDEHKDESEPMTLNGQPVGEVTGVYLKTIREVLRDMGQEDLLIPPSDPVPVPTPGPKREPRPVAPAPHVPPVLPYEEGGPPDLLSTPMRTVAGSVARALSFGLLPRR